MPKQLIVTVFLIAACVRPAWAIASFEAVKRDFQSSDTLVLDRDGEVLQRVRTDASVRRGQWVALADISAALRTALVLSEDKRFYEHSGVDWRAVSSAAWANVWNTKTRGASTLSMQLAGLLDDDLRASNSGRSMTQKIGQTFAAKMLEQGGRKDQILEAYLKLVPFRGEMVGIDALSRTLFGKAAHGLDEREAAIASALVRAPNAKAGQVAQRACGVLKALEGLKAPSKTECEGLDMFVAAALQRRSFEASEGMAPHLARRLLAQRPSAQALADAKPTNQAAAPPAAIHTSLRAPLQRFAVQTLTQQLRELSGRHVEDGAVVVLDNASGEVLAWVGSSGELSAAAEVDGVVALRQPGSTLKPFLYAQAIAERRITAASLLDDSAAQLTTDAGLYIPQNYDRKFKGWVSSRTALGASLNVPAVRTLVMVSPEAFHQQLKAVGLPLQESGDYYGYSLALGSSEVSLLNLTNAYRTLANGGRYSAVALAKNAKPVFSPVLDGRAAFIVSDILADPLARARTFGTDSILTTRFWSAVKTGTSKDMRDNWALGYSSRYTVGVWVGNASGAPMWDVSGTSGAAPIWAAVMHYLHQNEASRPPAAPAGLVQTRVEFGGQLEAARSEWFIQGTEQAMFAIDSAAVNARTGKVSGVSGLSKKGQSAGGLARITAPASGTILALDPDIPPANQRLRLSAQGRGVQWLLNGKPLARGNEVQWPPWPGRHVVQLLNASGQVADEVKFEVRGAGLR
ncbi:hypothetical protein AwPolaro_09810 [Polaromonas sp.]|nr:hypothetical protein AwPolaro_09810 [Polaromonas sp.]